MATKKTEDAANEVATQDPNARALAPIIDYGDDFGQGLDDVGQDEAGIPFLKILQAQSPEVIGDADRALEGAKAGLFLNTGTGELLTSLTIVPALRQHVFVEWRNKKEGGGIVGVHQPGDEMVQAAIAANAATIAEGGPSRRKQGKMKFGEFYTPAGNELVETFYVYGVVLDGESPEGFIVVPFSSSSIKKYKKQFISRARYCMVNDGTGHKRNPPMFAHRITLTTAKESNDDGTWSNFDVKFAVENNALKSLLNPSDAGYMAGRDLARMVNGGEKKADLSKADAGTDGGGEADGGSAF